MGDAFCGATANVASWAMRRLARLLVVAALWGCDDPLAPPPESVTISVCDGSNFVAYRNQGADWVVLGHADGTYTFDATERLVFAKTRWHSYDGTTLSMYHISREEAARHFTCESWDPTPASISGTVVGQPQYGWTMLTYGAHGAYVPYTQTGFQVKPQQGSVNLFAVRYDSIGGQIVGGRAILRQGLSYSPGETIPVLDWGSSEAFQLQTNMVSTTASHVGAFVYYISGRNGLSLGSAFSGQVNGPSGALSVPIRTVPAARMAPGDLHELTLLINDRRVQRYFRTPGDFTLDFGPPVAEPSLTTVSYAPYQVRVELPSQREYPDHVFITIGQHRANGTGTTYHFIATRDGIGRTPDRWSFTTPDLSALPGFPGGVYLNQDFIGWQVSAGSGKFQLSWKDAVDGDVVRTASRNSQ
jgi:hypothetical protein